MNVDKRQEEMDSILHWMKTNTVLGVLSILLLSFLTFNFILEGQKNLQTNLIPDTMCAIGTHEVCQEPLDSSSPALCSCVTDTVTVGCPAGTIEVCPVSDNDSPVLCSCVTETTTDMCPTGQHQVCTESTNGSPNFCYCEADSLTIECATGSHDVWNNGIHSCEPNPSCPSNQRACCPKDTNTQDNVSPTCTCKPLNQTCSGTSDVLSAPKKGTTPSAR